MLFSRNGERKDRTEEFANGSERAEERENEDGQKWEETGTERKLEREQHREKKSVERENERGRGTEIERKAMEEGSKTNGTEMMCTRERRRKRQNRTVSGGNAHFLIS